jgi:competence protein ComEA
MPDSLTRYRGYLLWTVILLFAGGAAFYYFTNRPAPKPITIITPTPRPSPTPLPSPTPIVLVVQVSGAVARPGLVRLPEGSRVDDAIKAAGGFRSDADEVRVNLAKRVADGELIVVPRLGETPPAPVATTPGARATATATSAPTIVNINTATVDELDKLPGIGPTTARNIIEYRQANGPFQKPEDIMKVRGIGQSLYDGIKNLISVR